MSSATMQFETSEMTLAGIINRAAMTLSVGDLGGKLISWNQNDAPVVEAIFERPEDQEDIETNLIKAIELLETLYTKINSRVVSLDQFGQLSQEEKDAYHNFRDVFAPIYFRARRILAGIRTFKNAAGVEALTTAVIQ
jgi:hypothetical protein